MIGKSLFDGETIYLSAFNRDEDTAFEAEWSHDPYFGLIFNPSGGILTAEAVMQWHARRNKETERDNSVFLFSIRQRRENCLIGLLLIDHIAWTHATGRICVAIGDQNAPDPCFAEALHLGLVYSFLELNLFRVSARVAENDQRMIKLLGAAGFSLEVCQKEALFLNDHHWDINTYGLRFEEWEKGRA